MMEEAKWYHLDIAGLFQPRDRFLLTGLIPCRLDLFSDVLDVRVRRGAELSTDHHLVYSLLLGDFETCAEHKICKSPSTYRIK